MKRHTLLILSITLLPLLLISLGNLVHAQDQAPFRGSFVYVPEKSDNVEQSIKNATEKMNFIVRGIARERLSKTNQPYGRITLDTTPSSVSITTDARSPIRTSPDGSPIKWKREDGEIFDVSTRWEGEILKQTFAAEDGKRINAYKITPDGQFLEMLVTVSSEKLKEPVQYKLVYKRAA